MTLAFRVGDKASYPARGVVEIVGIEERTIDGQALGFYVLRALVSDDKVLVPVTGANDRGLRPLASVDEAKSLYSLLDEPGALDPKEAPTRRIRLLKERLDLGSLHETALVYRDLQRLRAHKTLSFGENRLLETARNRMALELSFTEQRDAAAVAGDLDAHFGASAA